MTPMTDRCARQSSMNARDISRAYSSRKSRGYQPSTARYILACHRLALAGVRDTPDVPGGFDLTVIA
jgi:hypothetical protein